MRKDIEFVGYPSSENTTTLPIFIDMSVSCGFPSPAADYTGQELNLNEYFVRNPASTYIVRASGDSMIDAGIHPGDLLIVDRAKEPRNGSIVLAYFDGQFTVKRFFIKNGQLELHPENANANYPIFIPTPEEECSIEGVIVGLGRRF